MKKLLLLFLFVAQFLYPAQDYKIYDTLQVNHNTIRLDILDFKNQTISGKAEIALESKIDNLKYIPILLQNMQIDSILIDGQAVKSFQYDSTLLRIPVATPLKKGQETLLSIKYRGKPAGSSFGGLVIREKPDRAHNMGTSLSETPHSYARSWYPATDDFRSRSTFDLYYRINNDLKAVSTGILQDTIPNGDNTTTWHWRVNHAIPDYLVGIAIGEYKKIHHDYRQSSRNLPIDIYVYPEEVEAAEKTYDIVPKVLEIMEKYFGEMIFDRVGYVSVSGTQGAMEHVNNISMPDNPGPYPAYQELVIHELIHSWFGNQVTCATAEDMWLNEGITSFLTGVVLEELFPGKIAANYWKRCQTTALIITQMYEKKYHPIYPMPQEFTYGPTVYMKGAMIMAALRNEIGDEVLFPALKEYLRTYSQNHITTADFMKCMSRILGKNLPAFFAQSIYNPGFMSFEINSLKGSFDGTSYKGVLSVEQKTCGGMEYGKDLSVPVTFFNKAGTKSGKIAVRIEDICTESEISLSFEPAFGIVDADYEICKASTSEVIRIDSAKVYPAVSCNASITCKSVREPFTAYLEYYQVAPDPCKPGSGIQLYPNCYWRLNGLIPSSSELSGQFKAIPNSKELIPLKDSGKPILLLYRPTQEDDWTLVTSLPFDDFLKNGMTAESLIPGEYCLGV